MGSKCCKHKPRCKDCPKRKGKKGAVAVNGEKRPIF